MKARGVIFDLVAAQSPSYRGRGIARYSTELVRAIAEAHPELVSAIVVHPELGPPEGLDDLGRWLTAEPDWDSGAVVHLSSVFEPEVPVQTFWPREASSHHLLTAVTVYDLIPDVFPGWYLEDPGLRRRWRCCREVVRAADAVLTLSESARQDTIALLGVPEKRVTVIGSGTSPVFCRPVSRPAALKVARKGARGLKKDFIIYTGAFNPRKNVDRLIEGYRTMPATLIERHQLVIVCEAPPLTRNHYLTMAKEMGLEGRVLITGFVPEPVLVALYQSAALAVFPSLYEGYGLPVVESMACGTPSIAGDNSSLREILPREARFQPEDPHAIGEAMERALHGTAYRERLIALTAAPPPSWASVAERATAVFEDLLRRAGTSPAGWRRRLRLALVDVPTELATAVAAQADCDIFGGPVDDPELPPGAPPGPMSWAALSRLDAWRGGYDAVLGWADRLDEQAIWVMEQLATNWPGRSMAVVDREKATTEEAAISKLENLGLRVLPSAEGWEATANLVTKAARAPGGDRQRRRRLLSTRRVAGAMPGLGDRPGRAGPAGRQRFGGRAGVADRVPGRSGRRALAGQPGICACGQLGCPVGYR